MALCSFVLNYMRANFSSSLSRSQAHSSLIFGLIQKSNQKNHDEEKAR
jgi:hypothetical protein